MTSPGVFSMLTTPSCTLYSVMGSGSTVISAHGRLKFMGQKTGVGVYTEKPFVRITHIHMDHRIIKKRGWALS